MLRAGEVLLKSFKTARLPTRGCSLRPFYELLLWRVMALAAAAMVLLLLQIW